MTIFSFNHPKKCEFYIYLLGISFDQSLVLGGQSVQGRPVVVVNDTLVF